MKNPWEAMLYWNGQWVQEYGISPEQAQLLGLALGPIDDWIHLSKEAHDIVVGHCVDVCVGDWLRNPLGPPQVASVTCLDPPANIGSPMRFRVLFSRAVTGVDESDFAPVNGGTLAGSHIIDVIVENTGKATYAKSYIVTVVPGSGTGKLGLQVLDDNSIKGTDGKSLGGPATGDGNFVSSDSAAYVQVYGMPIAAWPIALALLGVAGLRLRRRTR